MTLVDDIAADYEFVDAIESVTFTDASASADTENVQATREQYAKSGAGSGAVALETHTIVWELWNATLNLAVPEQGDTITDSASVVWTIESVAVVQIGATIIKYRCVCSRQQ